MDSVKKSLIAIVGEECVSNEAEELYIYSHDTSGTEPRMPDFVVVPQTTEQVQAIIKLANKEKVAVVPWGAGLCLSSLAYPLRGGITLDMRRMDKIIEVNPMQRYALIEAGVSHGQLIAYLDKHHPHLKHSIPQAPTQSTVVGNAVIHGQGDITVANGFLSEMINGLEVVLPTGEICKIGSSSVSPNWHARLPLPDMAGLFLGWAGTTGVITKMSVRLYPKKKIREAFMFMLEDPEQVPDTIYKVTQTEAAEDIAFACNLIPMMMSGLHLVIMWVVGDNETEVDFKKKLIQDALGGYIRKGDGGLMYPAAATKEQLSQRPIKASANVADDEKGGGYAYVGGAMPLEAYPECYRKGVEIAERHGFMYHLGGKVIGRAHSIMYCFSYAHNRADPERIRHTREALRETEKYILEAGGVVWKPMVQAQELMLERMDPNTRELMRKIKKMLDPNGIMNPGNWEA